MTEFNPEDIINLMLREALKNIIKEYDDNVFEVPTVGPVPAIPTGSIALDEALGCGGIPQGRLTIIAGLPSTGKSSLCMEIVKSAQSLYPDKTCLYVDMESGAFTAEYANNMGINLNPNHFIYIKPDYAEQGMVIIHNLISTGQVSVCVWDSIAGAFTKESAENTAEDNDSRGLTARLLSNQLPKLANKCGKTGTAFILVNQIRTQMTRTVSWQDITGGYAQKFYSSVRIDLADKEKEKDYSGIVDRKTVVAQVSKNKVAIPYKSAQFDIRLGYGILKEANVLDVATAKGVSLIKAKGGGWYYFYNYEGEEIQAIRGKDKAVNWLVDNPAYCGILEREILGYGRDYGYVPEYCEFEPVTEADMKEEIPLDDDGEMNLLDNMLALGIE
jgi:recombination protein RecA